jgi:hypothetical protein
MSFSFLLGVPEGWRYRMAGAAELKIDKAKTLINTDV